MFLYIYRYHSIIFKPMPVLEIDKIAVGAAVISG